MTGSVASLKGFPGYSVYAASKAALHAFARGWLNELKGRNIRVNVLHPGPIATPMQDQVLTEGRRGVDVMAKKHTDIADSCPINQTIESHPLFTRREMLGVAGMGALTAVAGMTPLAGSTAGPVPQTTQTRPRIACLASFWGAPGSHADSER